MAADLIQPTPVEIAGVPLVDPLLLGRASPELAPGLSTRQLFGSIGRVVPDAVTSLDNLISLGSVCRGGRGSYLVSGGAREVLRITGDAVTPLQLQQILGTQALPAGATRADRATQVKLRVTANLDNVLRIFVIDLQQSIEVIADMIAIDLVTPTGMITIPPASGVPTATGFVVDALASASVSRIESPIGPRYGRLGQIVHVPQGVSRAIEIPPYADSVWWSNPEGTTTPLGIDVNDRITAGAWQIGLAQVDVTTPLDGSATHLYIAGSEDGDRMFNLVWRISP